MKLLISIYDYCYAVLLKICSYFHKYEMTTFNPDLPTVIIVPGVYENWFYFRTIRTYLLKRGYNIINADSLYRSKSIAEDANALSSYINDNSFENVILIGHSSGGITALKCLKNNDRIKKVIAIAVPFSGVKNGHFLRTTRVRELLPNSDEIKNIKIFPTELRNKAISIYPTYDNQIWSKSGSLLEGVKSIKLKSNGHHLILKSDELLDAISRVLLS